MLGKSGTKQIEVASFRYPIGSAKAVGTGSMIPAGVAILSTCEELLGARCWLGWRP